MGCWFMTKLFFALACHILSLTVILGQSANLFNKQIKMLQDGGGLQDFTNGEGAKEGGCLIRERD